MFEWLKPRRDAAPPVFSRDTGASQAKRALAGPYQLLYTYLDTRFADTVVLTFAQIEDVMGLALPAQARLETAWWTDGAGGGSAPHYSQAWTVARRTAEPNLTAQIVSFARLLT